MTRPLAWLIMEKRHDCGLYRVMSAQMFVQRNTAEAAARRLTNSWRTCTAVPVVRMVEP